MNFQLTATTTTATAKEQHERIIFVIFLILYLVYDVALKKQTSSKEIELSYHNIKSTIQLAMAGWLVGLVIYLVIKLQLIKYLITDAWEILINCKISFVNFQGWAGF